jgi:hypothetical protein
MVETHTISAPEKNWEQVYTYAKQHNTNASEITRRAWEQFFTGLQPKKTIIRKTELVILLFQLVIISILLSLIGVIRI